MRKVLQVFLLICVVAAIESTRGLDAQDHAGMVKYSPDFRFTDGIYLNFDQVKNNSPIPKAKILTSTDYNDKDFFKNLMSGEKIYFYDTMGMRQEVNKADIWGYARNGILFIQIQGNFSRITFVGSICHFVADITSYDNRYYNNPYGYYDPYYYSPYYSPYYYPYYNPYYYRGYSPYGSYYSPYRQNLGRNELKQYLIDFDEGKILEYDVENTKLLLMKDPELYDEYVRLSRKKKKDLMFVFIRRFNEKNPLYLPANLDF